MMSTYRVGFIGVGSMGQSILAGLLRSEIFSPDDISIVGRGAARADRISARYNVQRHASIADLAENNDVICLCMKPKDLRAVADKMDRVDLTGKLVISTLAGVSGQSLHDLFPEASLIRAIPNIASEIGEGVTLWAASEETPPAMLDFARLFWSAVGTSIEVEDEYQIDLGTPISGAAPAFMGLFMEAIVDAGVYLGLPRDMAAQLVLQSLRGSCDLIRNQDLNAQVVRHRVTSPGGLTAVSMSRLEAAGMRQALMDAVQAGHAKTVELGRQVNAV